jgi:dihydrofolate reductase
LFKEDGGMRKLVFLGSVDHRGFHRRAGRRLGFLPVLGQSRPALDIDETRNRGFDTVLMTRGAYARALKGGVTSPYPHLRQYVLGRPLTARDPEVTVLADDPVAFVRDLKRGEGGDIWLCGGGEVTGVLWPEVDELVVMVNPATLAAGDGIRFARRNFDPTLFALVSSEHTEKAVVLLRYARSAEDW